MLQLSGGRIRTAFDSYARSRKMEITESFYTKGCRLLEQLLGGNKSLTKQELMDGFGRAGVETDNHLIHYFLVRAETDGDVYKRQFPYRVNTGFVGKLTTLPCHVSNNSGKLCFFSEQENSNNNNMAAILFI